ncbi:MAG: hypothetical protein L6Q73_20105 [Aquabacterium sp.]|nr:hypothetical protein [Aquabacterium sp.]
MLPMTVLRRFERVGRVTEVNVVAALDKYKGGYIKGFSTNVQRVFEYFEFEADLETTH